MSRRTKRAASAPPVVPVAVPQTSRSDGSPPRHFVGEGPARTLGPPVSPLHPLDLFRAGNETWTVLADGAGDLRVVGHAGRELLSPGARRELNAQERAATPRSLLLEEFWLFSLRHLEPLKPVPGLDDPIEVGGVLFGPFPGPGTARPGRLTVTRGELLDALLTGTWHPFRVLAGSREHGTVSGGLLAAGAEEHTAAGHGLVLAYPLPPGAAELGESGNADLVRGVLHDLLSAIRSDQAEEGVGTLRQRELPVVNRAALEASLEVRGFEVVGDEATRRRNGLLGGLFPERVRLPPSATLEDLLALTRVALAELPGYPSRHIEAVHRRMRLAEVTWTPEGHSGLWPGAAQCPAIEVRRSAADQEGRLVSPPGRRRVDAGRREAGLEATAREVGFLLDPAFPVCTQDLLEVEVELLDGAGPGDLRAVVPRGDRLDKAQPWSFSGTRKWVRHAGKVQGLIHPALHARDFDLALVVRGARAVAVRRVTVRRV